jgi:hypothetical protein
MTGDTRGNVNETFYGYRLSGVAGDEEKAKKEEDESPQRQACASMTVSKPLVFH